MKALILLSSLIASCNNESIVPLSDNVEPEIENERFKFERPETI